MKKILKYLTLLFCATFVSFTIVSCAGLSSLSDEEAYNLGYGIGKMIRNN